MSEIFIIDEWLLSDLNGENGKESQIEATSFLEALYKKCDKIAVGKGSKFQEKEWNFSENASRDVVRRKIARFYFGMIRCNSQKYEGVDIEDEEEINLKDINPDDHYLVRTYNKIRASIITTDIKLIDSLKKRDIPCKLRDEFLREYLHSSL